MKITYLGTAASEGLPALFCQCPVCAEARKNGGKDFRGRAGAAINDIMLIDCPPDIYYAAQRAGVDLSLIEDIVVTHAHEDHFDPYELSTRREPVYCVHNDGKKLRVHANMRAGELLDKYVKGAATGHAEDHCLCFNYAPSFEPIETAAGVTVYPLPADHDRSQECRMLLLEEKAGGKRFLYGHDTGIFPEATLEFLRGKYCNAISLDCTNVMLGNENDRNHMGLRADIVMKAKLIEIGAADENTRFICHHLSHNGFIANSRVYSRTEFEQEAAKYGFEVSYDTMTLEI